VRALLERLRRRLRWWDTPDRRGALRIVDDVLEIYLGQDTRARIARGAVVAVDFYKRDMIGVDDICCQIQVDGGAVWRFDEEMPGWHDAVAWLERLPRFRRDWFKEVAFPAFETNLTRVYERRGEGALAD
jgi:hypothetical protein